MAGSKDLGTLLGDSIAFCKTHMTAIVVGAVVFGLIAQGTMVWMGTRMMQWQNTVTVQQMEDVRMRLENAGSDMAPEEVEAMAEQMVRSGMMGGLLRFVLPTVGISMLIVIAIGLLAKSYYLVVAVRGFSDPAAAFQSAAGSIVRLIGLWIWMFLRSFAWIPVIGIVTAIVIGPRLILAPIYLLEQGKGITESTRMSYAATSGWWGKIFGHLLVVGLCAVILSAIVTTVLSMVVGMTIGGFANAIIQQLVGAFIVVYAILLGRTLMQAGPRA